MKLCTVAENHKLGKNALWICIRADNLSTQLSLPIAGLKTKMQGTLGFYFRIGEDLYAVTARHVLFNLNESKYEYHYVGTFLSLFVP